MPETNITSTNNSNATPQTAAFVKGLEGVVAAQTALSLVDGAGSQLYYRGIPIHELTQNSTYEESILLLWNGKLPSASELADFKKELSAQRKAPKEVLALLKKFPKKAHPMGVLRSIVSALGLFDKEADWLDIEKSNKKRLFYGTRPFSATCKPVGFKIFVSPVST